MNLVGWWWRITEKTPLVPGRPFPLPGRENRHDLRRSYAFDVDRFPVGLVVGILLALAVVGFVALRKTATASTPRPASNPPLQETLAPSPGPPKTRTPSPLGPPQPTHLPGKPGSFSYGDISFEYPRDWEWVVTYGYTGLAGGLLWEIPLGKDKLNFVRVMADYFPTPYSVRQTG